MGCKEGNLAVRKLFMAKDNEMSSLVKLEFCPSEQTRTAKTMSCDCGKIINIVNVTS